MREITEAELLKEAMARGDTSVTEAIQKTTEDFCINYCKYAGDSDGECKRFDRCPMAYLI